MQDEKVMVRNSADPEQVEEASRKTRIKAKTEALDLKFVMSSVQGRRVMSRILESSGLNESTYRADPNRTYYVMGARDFGLNIQEELLTHCEEEHDLMVKEARKAKNG
jgi:hypothetical protein